MKRMISLLQYCLPRSLKPRPVAPRPTALCYHGIVREKLEGRLERNFHRIADFRSQVRIFRRQGVTPLAELATTFPKPAIDRSSLALITFDDGYANNLLAAEILAESRLPWTLFVSTAAVGRQGAIWTVELSLLLLHGRGEKLEALGRSWPLQSRAQREDTFQGIRYPMKAMPARLRQQTMQELRAQFPAGETARLLEQFPAFQMLTWPELRQLAGAGVEIGSHGVDHELHHAAQDPEVRRSELVESKSEIERQLGRPCRFFAFPNGDHCAPSAGEVEAAGYELAFTTQPGRVQPGSNRFLLPRLSPGGTVAKLKRQLKDLT